MRWRQQFKSGLIIAACWACATIALHAQTDDGVFDSGDLPSILSDDEMDMPPDLPDADDLGKEPFDEELPPAPTTTPAPQIDSTMDREFSNDFRAPQANSDAAAGFGDTSGFPTVESDDTDEAEIVPQETIQERYSDGSIHIERGVSQDEQENYVNHGPWRMWDEEGNLIAEGTYRFGKRHGKWSRWYRPEEAELFQQPPFNLFNGPFLSTAVFVDGELNGKWLVADPDGKRICDWSFVNGHRHGESTWYYHTGRPMRVIKYREGEIDGELLEWDLNGEQVTRVMYENGRRLEKVVESFEDGQKKVEGHVLQAQLIMKDADDWWEAKLATYTRRGEDQKHGEWVAWYPNGQKKFAGHYALDEPSGEFNWWHTNGQRALAASYVDGRKSGEWTWWHENGQKSIQGAYQDNSPVGRWVWWHDDGKVAQRVDFSAAAPGYAGADSTDGESIMIGQPQN